MYLIPDRVSQLFFTRPMKCILWCVRTHSRYWISPGKYCRLHFRLFSNVILRNVNILLPRIRHIYSVIFFSGRPSPPLVYIFFVFSFFFWFFVELLVTFYRTRDRAAARRVFPRVRSCRRRRPRRWWSRALNSDGCRKIIFKKTWIKRYELLFAERDDDDKDAMTVSELFVRVLIKTLFVYDGRLKRERNVNI